MKYTYLDITDWYGTFDQSHGTYPSAAVPPQFSVATDTTTPTEGEQFVRSLPLVPPIPIVDIALTNNGALVNDTRFTVTATSLTIADVTRNDSGVYQIIASNVAGSDTFTLTVDVYCECLDTPFMYNSVHYCVRYVDVLCGSTVWCIPWEY